MRPTLAAVLTALLVSVGVVLTGCQGSAPKAEPTPSDTSPTSYESAQVPEPKKPPKAPPVHACYALTYDGALAPTSSRKPVSCSERHTSITYALGRLPSFAPPGSDRAQRTLARVCRARFVGFVGGTVDGRRLSVLRPVWFTATADQFARGARWFRCDAIAVARSGHLAPITTRLQGVVARQPVGTGYRLCGTAEPGTSGFDRVPCLAQHSWKALSVVHLAGGAAYPGEGEVRAAGQEPCRYAAADVAADPLSYQWSYEWPSRAQWRDGQHYGFCWTPS